MTNIIVILEDRLKILLEETIMRIEQRKGSNSDSAIYSINQVAKKLGLSHSTVKKYVRNGVIKSTSNGRITQAFLNEYLEG